MRRLPILFLLLTASLLPMAARAAESADTLAPLQGNWVQQLASVNFRINDPRIRYPRFANFCR